MKSIKSIESFLERSMLKHIALEFTYDNKYIIAAVV